MKKQDQGLVSFSIYESVESVLAAGCTGLINLRHLFSFLFYGSKINRLLPKSLERSPAVGDFYGTGIEIWAEFGPGRQLLRLVFSCFHGQKKILKNILDGENIFGVE